eukprot:TRINITY_DN13603_c0_g1_i1.p1 TRINITY_DN13603_c0_g1~~TRINITY_DN13603_c0_g1_i1.p1  ORF type:complete len:186 (+),score=8.15 TRINITY_DN13603_c0_g1_i1:34-558(+)
MPPGSEARPPPTAPISDDTKQAWWNMPFLSTFEPRPPAPKPSAPPYVAPDRSRVSSALSPQGPKPPPQPLAATTAEESQSPVRDPGAEQTESSLHPATLQTPAVDQHAPPPDADPMGRKEAAAPQAQTAPTATGSELIQGASGCPAAVVTPLSALTPPSGLTFPSPRPSHKPDP